MSACSLILSVASGVVVVEEGASTLGSCAKTLVLNHRRRNRNDRVSPFPREKTGSCRYVTQPNAGRTTAEPYEPSPRMALMGHAGRAGRRITCSLIPPGRPPAGSPGEEVARWPSKLI